MIQKINTQQAINSKAGRHNKKSNELSTAKKVGIFATTALGLGVSVAIMSKMNKFSLNPKTILKTPFKDTYVGSKRFLEKEIIGMGLGSCTGGLIGGALFDKKENFPAKCRETVVQLSNIATPILFVGAGSRLGGKITPKLKEFIKPMFKDTKISAGTKKVLTALPKTIGALGGLAIGISIGNQVSKLVNKCLFGKTDKRPVEATDMSAHLDDMCAAANFISDSPIVHGVSRLIPIALLVPGNEIGKTQER